MPLGYRGHSRRRLGRQLGECRRQGREKRAHMLLRGAQGDDGVNRGAVALDQLGINERNLLAVLAHGRAHLHVTGRRREEVTRADGDGLALTRR
ncbi:Uncharacterised protein [Mycobacteroides abscessus subsp. abscessus]|nr:Uncharacterised protein [Mycobacteroides abscessus subsp. abscessus]